jgi:hypothetical protein
LWRVGKHISEFLMQAQYVVGQGNGRFYELSNYVKNLYFPNYKYAILKQVACRLFLEDDILELILPIECMCTHALTYACILTLKP